MQSSNPKLASSGDLDVPCEQKYWGLGWVPPLSETGCFLNKLYGLITESTKIYAQFNSNSRTRDQEEGRGCREADWVPSTAHFPSWRGPIQSRLPAGPWQLQK